MRKFFSSLYDQVLAAIALGVLLGFYVPDWAVPLKPLGDGFIKLIKMLIAPIIFTTVVVGMGDMKKCGRVGVRALILARCDGVFDRTKAGAILLGSPVAAGLAATAEGSRVAA